MKLFSAFFLLLSGCAFAQSDSLYQVCSGRNRILFPEHLQYFFERVSKESTQFEEPVDVIQIGDSHVQMSHFPRALNVGLDTLFGGSEETSLWFPYSFVGGYTPGGYKVSYSGKSVAKRMVNADDGQYYAITGHALELQPEKYHYSELTIDFNGKKFDYLEILAEQTGLWSMISDSLHVSYWSNGMDQKVYSAHSDSLVGKMTLTVFNADTVKPLRIFGFRCFTYPCRTHLVDFQFYGSSGAKYSDYIANKEYLRQDLRSMRADLLIISLGTNDGYLKQGRKFRREVDKLIKGLKRQLPHMDILLTLPPDTFYSNQKPRSAAFVNRTLIGIAKKYHCAIWDFGSVMGGDQSILSWCSNGLTHEDLLHLNKAGYDLQGLLLSEAIYKAYSDWQAN